MFNTIVVGCDGSPSSLDAVALAQQLRSPEGRLVLVSSFSMYKGFASPTAPALYGDWLEDRARECLDRAEGRLDPGVPYEKQTLAATSAAQALDCVAGTVNADLIVVGPTHHSKLGTLTGRSTVQRMLHGAPCALAVAANGQDRRFTGAPRIAVAYDGSPESQFALDTAYGISGGRGGTVLLCTALEHIVYATGFAGPLPDEADDRRREASAREELVEAAGLAPDGVRTELRVGWGAPSRTVLELAGEDADLVVAGSRGFGALHRVIAGSTSTGLLTDGRVPVLVTPRAATK